MVPLQVEKWDRKMLMHFWEKWYFPANAVLYIVGDLSNSVAEIEGLIEKAFGAVPAGREKLPGSSAGDVLHNGNGASHSSSSNGASKDKAALEPLKQKHEVGCDLHFPQALLHALFPCNILHMQHWDSWKGQTILKRQISALCLSIP